jgi:uncharacterized damage-inducible protein DinB
MNLFCKSTLNQINIALQKTNELLDCLEESDLLKRPTPNKHSIGELLEHIAIICQTDLLISMGATKGDLNKFYSNVSLRSIIEIRKGIFDSFKLLEETYMSFTELELQEEITSYWGTTYSRYEWLLEILAHVYHHRGQLHAVLVHCYKKDIKVMMFE